MYSVESLKQKFENYLASQLEVENSAKIFKYAAYYNHDRLKKICLCFINDNFKPVIDSQEFEELNRDSMLEIIRFSKK